MGHLYSIHAVAQATKVRPSTLRSWESHGLLFPAKTPKGHRRYRQEDIDRVRDIRRFRAIQGLNLAAIEVMLGGRRGRQDGRQAHDDALGARLLALRVQQGLTLREVSRRTGLAPSFINAIERGVEEPSVATLKKLTRCYSTTLAALTAPRAVRPGKVIRAGEYRVLPVLGPGIQVEQLAEGRLAMDCQRWTLQPGAASQGPYAHEGEEFIHVLSGRFSITLDGREEYELWRGDSMYFKSSSFHAWVNPGPEPAVLLWINTPPTF